MAHLKQTAQLTMGYRADIGKTIQQTHAGQAHFANGPLGATCSMCTHYGCWRQKRNASGDVIGTTRVQNACEKYRQLTGRIVAGVPPNAAACKYFSRKKED